MSNVYEMPKREIDLSNFLCPVCFSEPEFFAVEKDRWYACRAHKVCWHMGRWLSREALDTPLTEHEANGKLIAGFTQVDPADGSEPNAPPLIQEAAARRKEALGKLSGEHGNPWLS